MPEEATPSPEVAGEINIQISDEKILYNTNFSVPEIIFWLEVVRSMIMDKVKNPHLNN